MKRLLKSITAGAGGLHFQDKAVFTPTDLVSILSEIEELKKCCVGLKPSDDGILLLIVGNNEYEISDKTQMVFV